MNAEQDLLPFAQREMTDAHWRERIAALLDVLAFNSRHCKACGRKVWFTKNKSGKFGVWGDDGLSHFATCPHASDFQKPKAKP
jgi:hypothetical protein